MKNLQTPEAQTANARFMFLGGCCLLPLLWTVSVWYFWSEWRLGGPECKLAPETEFWVRRSAIGAAVSGALFVLWIIIFQASWRAAGGMLIDIMVVAPEGAKSGW